MVGGAALIEDDDFGAAVMGLTGCHQTRAAGAEDDDIGLHVPLGRDFLLNARRMSKRCAEEGAAGKILCVHDGYHLKFRLKEWQSLHSRRDLP